MARIELLEGEPTALLESLMRCREERGHAFAGSCPAMCEKWLIPR